MEVLNPGYPREYLFDDAKRRELIGLFERGHSKLYLNKNWMKMKILYHAGSF